MTTLHPEFAEGLSDHERSVADALLEGTDNPLAASQRLADLRAKFHEPGAFRTASERRAAVSALNSLELVANPRVEKAPGRDPSEVAAERAMRRGNTHLAAELLARDGRNPNALSEVEVPEHVAMNAEKLKEDYQDERFEAIRNIAVDQSVSRKEAEAIFMGEREPAYYSGVCPPSANYGRDAHPGSPSAKTLDQQLRERLNLRYSFDKGRPID